MLGTQTKSIMTPRFLTILAALLFTIYLRADDRPNVLFIAVDDLNHWVSHTWAATHRQKLPTLTGWLPWGPPLPTHTPPYLPANLPVVP